VPLGPAMAFYMQYKKNINSIENDEWDFMKSKNFPPCERHLE
jgi:hypothetical protein